MFDALVRFAKNTVNPYAAGASRPTLRSQQAWALKLQEQAALEAKGAEYKQRIYYGSVRYKCKSVGCNYESAELFTMQQHEQEWHLV
jgi:hypothetical protein